LDEGDVEIQLDLNEMEQAETDELLEPVDMGDSLAPGFGFVHGWQNAQKIDAVLAVRSLGS